VHLRTTPAAKDLLSAVAAVDRDLFLRRRRQHAVAASARQVRSQRLSCAVGVASRAAIGIDQFAGGDEASPGSAMRKR